MFEYKILREGATFERQTDRAAAYDLHAMIPAPLILKPHQKATIHTGVAVSIGHPLYVGLLVVRSGIGTKRDISLSNSVGVIDADYQGEIMVTVRNASDTDVRTIAPKERIAQILFTKLTEYNFTMVEEFSEMTARGSNGFGSTGR